MIFPEQISPRDAFRQAIVVELPHPESAMFFLAFLPQFVSIYNGPSGVSCSCSVCSSS